MKVKLSTKEEELMGILWRVQRSSLKEIVELLPEPQPAMTTVATMLKRLIDKKAIAYDKEGKSRIYYPLIKQEEYSSHSLHQMIDHVFQGSTARFASFFTRRMGLSDKELRELRDIIDEQLDQE